MVTLTDSIVRKLTSPAKGNKVYYDDTLAGFGCRVTAAGARSFVLNYRVKGSGRERRTTVGGFPSWSTTAARAKARELRRAIDDGADPVGAIEAEREAPLVSDVADRFVKEHLPRLRPGSARNYHTLLKKHVLPALGRMKLSDVRYADVDRMHQRITAGGAPFAANRATTVFATMCSLAVRWGWRIDNPAKNIPRNPEPPRRRYMAGAELPRLLAALANHPNQQVAAVVRVLLLSGCRVGEALSMRWADIDFASSTWHKRPAATKQGRHHSAPMSAPLRQLLAEVRAKQIAEGGTPTEFVFPGKSSASGHYADIHHEWHKLCQDAGIAGLRLHDLRHSFASELASSGSSLLLIGSLLGHSNPNTTARYSHLFDDPQRAAVERVGAAIDAAGKGDSSEPIPLLPLRGGRRGH